jgi:hypothetical protein
MMKQRVRMAVWWALTAALMVVAHPALGRDEAVTASAQVSSTSVYAGDTVTLQITVNGAGSAVVPEIKIAGVQAEYLGGSDQSSSMTYNINGKVTQQTTRQYAMQWRLTPSKAGDFTIPSIAVTVGGGGGGGGGVGPVQTARTRPISIRVAEPGESADFRLTVSSEKTTAYVGEAIRLKLVWYLGKAARNAQISGNDGGQEYDVYPAPDPRPVGTGQEDDRYPQIMLLGRPTHGELAQGDWDGRQVTTFTQELIVVPKSAGKLELGPFQATFDAVTGQRKRNIFDSPWDDRSMTQRVAVASGTATVEVKALPTAGKPADFSGLVGTYAIESSISATEANVGDPLTLSVRISGEEPMAGVEAPDLARVPGFEENFRLSPEGWDGGGGGKAVVPGRRTYSMTVRPQSDTVTEIPGISLSYFDTKSGEYRRATSAAIGLKVKGVRQVTLGDAVGVVPPGGVAKVEPPKRSEAGIRANVSMDEALINQRVIGMSWVWRGEVWAVVGGPPLLALGTIFAVRRARAVRSPRDRALGAIAQGRRALGKAGDARGVGQALRVAVGGALGVDCAVVTSADAAGLPDEARDAARGALAIAERVDFGGVVEGAGDLGALKQRASESMSMLERAIRARGDEMGRALA